MTRRELKLESAVRAVTFRDSAESRASDTSRNTRYLTCGIHSEFLVGGLYRVKRKSLFFAAEELVTAKSHLGKTTPSGSRGIR